MKTALIIDKHIFYLKPVENRVLWSKGNYLNKHPGLPSEPFKQVKIFLHLSLTLCRCGGGDPASSGVIYSCQACLPYPTTYLTIRCWFKWAHAQGKHSCLCTLLDQNQSTCHWQGCIITFGLDVPLGCCVGRWWSSFCHHVWHVLDSWLQMLWSEGCLPINLYIVLSRTIPPQWWEPLSAQVIITTE